MSIAPVHSLISAVMKGVGEPALLINGSQSPHSMSLAPSSIRKLNDAELLIWIGPEFETSLRKPIAHLDTKTQIINLSEAPGIQLLENRHAGVWTDGHGHGHAEAHDAQHQQAQSSASLQTDPHLWLSTQNAVSIIELVSEALMSIDPENAIHYSENAVQTIQKIALLKAELEKQLLPIKAVPYLVFHDAYHYFEHEFDLTAVGAITLSPEKSIGAKSLVEIKQTIENRAAKCIFHEPQFQPKLVKRIAQKARINTGELDPVGMGIEAGPEQWFQLMRNLKNNLIECLG